MGLDFTQRCAPTFHKMLDRRAIDLRTPSLFSCDVTSVARTAQAEICNGSQLKVGERLLVRMLAKDLVVQRANVVVAKFSNPPAEFVNFVQLGCGIARAEIHTVHPLSGFVEISLCE